MSSNRHTPEQIISKLGHADVRLANVATVAQSQPAPLAVATFVEDWLQYSRGYGGRRPLTMKAHRCDAMRCVDFPRERRPATPADATSHRHVRPFAASFSHEARATINRSFDALSSLF